MQRKLTKKFTTYAVNQYEKAHKCAIVDALDVGNLEVNKITDLIRLGNGKDCTEEQASQLLDEYLENDDENSIISAYLDLLGELDRDLRILKACGISIDELKESFTSEIANKTSNLKEGLGLVNKTVVEEEVESESEAQEI